MNNYICIKNQKIPLQDDQIDQLWKALGLARTKLADIAVGDTVKIGPHEMIVLEQSDNTTAVIRKDLLYENEPFGDTNDFDGSHVDELCAKFANEIAAIVGEENLVLHTVDLTTNDGLKDYGKIRRRASLLTAELYRRYVEVLDKRKTNKWWWLATAFSTNTHSSDVYILCVSPSGCICSDNVNYDNVGVRPFCILKSDIFVSK